MDDILFDLFYGDLRFNSDEFIHDKDYRAAVERSAQLEDTLLDSLQGQPRRDVAQLINDYGTINARANAEFFALGFRVGVQLFCASFHSVYSS